MDSLSSCPDCRSRLFSPETIDAVSRPCLSWRCIHLIFLLLVASLLISFDFFSNDKSGYFLNTLSTIFSVSSNLVTPMDIDIEKNVFLYGLEKIIRRIVPSRHTLVLH